MIQTFDIEQNFWDIYPDFKVALSFKDLYKRDKSRGKVNSSKLMWFVVYTRDLNYKYYRLSQEEKDAIIGADYMKNENFYLDNKEELDVLIEDYLRLMYSPERRHLMDWDKKLLQRSQLIASIPYTLDNYEELDKMAANTPKIYKAISDLKAELDKEEGEGSLKGGAMESLSD